MRDSLLFLASLNLEQAFATVIDLQSRVIEIEALSEPAIGGLLSAIRRLLRSGLPVTPGEESLDLSAGRVAVGVALDEDVR